jgi:glutaredoxin-like protein
MLRASNPCIQELDIGKRLRMAIEPILNKSIRTQIKNIFAELQDPIGVLLFTSNAKDCEFCEDARQLLEEVNSLTGKIKFSIFDLSKDKNVFERFNVEQIPTTILTTQQGEAAGDQRIRFIGIPGGNEFTSLIHGILMISRGDSGLTKDTRNYLRTLSEPLDLKIFVTPTCPYCPSVVVLAHKMAFESEKVTATMVEAIEFPELSDQFEVSGVPLIVINEGQGELLGAVPESQLVEKIRKVIS